MSNQTKCCPTCGAKMVEYKHTLNKGLVAGLARLYDAGGVSTVADLKLTVNQHNNFQKLQYWGLVERVDKSRWEITLIGRYFVAGKSMVYLNVWTYRGDVISRTSQHVSIDDIDSGYKRPEAWAEESRPHREDTGQLAFA